MTRALPRGRQWTSGPSVSLSAPAPSPAPALSPCLIRPLTAASQINSETTQAVTQRRKTALDRNRRRLREQKQQLVKFEMAKNLIYEANLRCEILNAKELISTSIISAKWNRKRRKWFPRAMWKMDAGIAWA